MFSFGIERREGKYSKEDGYDKRFNLRWLITSSRMGPLIQINGTNIFEANVVNPSTFEIENGVFVKYR